LASGVVSTDDGAVVILSAFNTSTLSSASSEFLISGTGDLQNIPDASDRSLPAGLAGVARLLILLLLTPGLRGGTGPVNRGDTGGASRSSCDREEEGPRANGWELGIEVTGSMRLDGTGFRWLHDDLFDATDALREGVLACGRGAWGMISVVSATVEVEVVSSGTDVTEGCEVFVGEYMSTLVTGSKLDLMNAGVMDEDATVVSMSEFWADIAWRRGFGAMYGIPSYDILSLVSTAEKITDISLTRAKHRSATMRSYSQMIWLFNQLNIRAPLAVCACAKQIIWKSR
jgi:hypothetical protein